MSADERTTETLQEAYTETNSDYTKPFTPEEYEAHMHEGPNSEFWQEAERRHQESGPSFF